MKIMFSSIKKNSMKNLAFLLMLSGLMLVAGGSVSAQDKCGEPGDEEVIIYEHVFKPGVTGECKKLQVGEYKNAAEMGLRDNIMSSIKVGKKVYAEICAEANFQGACEIFDQHDADLRNNPTIKNDTVSSVKVVKTKGEGDAKVCPGETGQKVGIGWTNNTGRTLRINWVNYNCVEEKNDREIKPGQVYDGDSYVGHIFVVRDFSTDEQLGHVIVTQSNAKQEFKK